MRGGARKKPKVAADEAVLVQTRIPTASFDAIMAKVESGEFSSVAHYVRQLIRKDLGPQGEE